MYYQQKRANYSLLLGLATPNSGIISFTKIKFSAWSRAALSEGSGDGEEQNRISAEEKNLSTLSVSTLSISIIFSRKNNNECR